MQLIYIHMFKYAKSLLFEGDDQHQNMDHACPKNDAKVDRSCEFKDCSYQQGVYNDGVNDSFPADTYQGDNLRQQYASTNDPPKETIAEQGR